MVITIISVLYEGDSRTKGEEHLGETKNLPPIFPGKKKRKTQDYIHMEGCSRTC